LEMTGRPVVRSPGRPPAGRREHRVVFWAAVVGGARSVDAARQAGVSDAVGVRWFREGGGMATVTLAPLSGRYLSFAEREEIALLRAQKFGVREIARRVGRAPSTISRELRRNAGIRSGSLTYRASTAQWHADRRGRRPKREAGGQRRVADAMCRTGSLGLSSGLTGSLSRDRVWSGRVGATARARTGAGRCRGVRSRSLAGCAWTSPMMNRCASPMRRFTNRCMCRAAARSVRS